ncbi:MarR family winged helix-turn-helix transcriptional regulator [Herbaspirillum robiniae]|uniref:MarR family transcriptional regulator n=1 Tax=Herbaspirillum robiniae TaxID=2014887 RepID=A0A246WVE4_9BURK|nr:MarR family transcriptional regulator [Herbaspirillum robiniae]OWY31060.1 MarR family transcriptional regulator [Herbaspirillum robiniae]
MFDHCLYFNTAALSRRLEREWTAAFSPFGLTAPQGFMLRAVIDQPGILQGRLAAELSIAKSTATRALDALKEKGFIERRKTDDDGREVSVFPTASATQIKAPLNASAGQAAERIRKILGKQEFSDAVQNIRSIRNALE